MNFQNIFNWKYLTIYLFIIYGSNFLDAQSPAETYIIQKTKFSRNSHHEFSPVYFGEGLVFVTNRHKGLLGYYSAETGGLLNLYFADTINKIGKQKIKYFSKELNTKINEGPVCFDSEQNIIYFTRNRLTEGSIKELSSPRNKLGIFSAELENGKWVNIKEFRFNNEWYNLTSPWLSTDGKKLFFASDMPGGYGGTDLYYCEWKEGYWDNPVNLGPIINSQGNEAYPFLSPSDELYFSSDGHEGLGGMDIYYSLFSESGWLNPVPLDYPINSKYNDFGFITDTLMSEGYFSSDRKKSLDIYHFRTIFPQVFYPIFQRENQYCYYFINTGTVLIDTSDLKFIWHLGDNESSEGELVKHCYEKPGDYHVRLNVVKRSTDELFLTKLSFELQIRELEQGYIQAPDILIVNEEFELTGTNSNLPGYLILDYAWDFGDGNRTYGDTVKHKYMEAGEYLVSLILFLTSKENNSTKKTSISRIIQVVENPIEKEYYYSEKMKRDQNFSDVRTCDNARIVNSFSIETINLQDAIFRLEVISSDKKIDINNILFRNIPKKYSLLEIYNINENTYSYTIEQQMSAMALYPTYNEIRGLGFKNAQVKLFPITQPAEKELYTLLKNYNTSTDAFFDAGEKLTTNAYVLLNQIVKFLTKYSEVKMEIGVHTDNLGSISKNISLSQDRANMLYNYFISRGLNSKRIIPKGYGESKPIAPNDYEINRRLNRRVEFVIF